MAHLESSRLQHMHRYSWCAANYLTIGQIYLQENPVRRASRGPAGTHQTPVAGTLGNLAWPQLHLRAPEPPASTWSSVTGRAAFTCAWRRDRRSAYPQAGPLMAWCQDMLAKHQTYTLRAFRGHAGSP